ncbi:peroxiredoxin [Staphylococcus delphini]|nr:peroxiredoxin [Staphylococcus delphini]PCF71640.1 peroxiredoxin [Staphylococcus delphini]
MMAIIYQTTATNTGGRKGHVQTDDNKLEFRLAPPDNAKEDETNPEQLFATGYASCFNGAFDLMLKRNGFRKAEPVVDLTVKLMDDPNSESPMLGVDIQAKVKNMSQEDAEKCLEEAHAFCPYSKATNGNIEFSMNVTVED